MKTRSSLLGYFDSTSCLQIFLNENYSVVFDRYLAPIKQLVWCLPRLRKINCSFKVFTYSAKSPLFRHKSLASFCLQFKYLLCCRKDPDEPPFCAFFCFRVISSLQTYDIFLPISITIPFDEHWKLFVGSLRLNVGLSLFLVAVLSVEYEVFVVP